MKEFLVSTSLIETFPQKGKAVFLGNWCKQNSEKNFMNEDSPETLEYHWDNKLKFENDYSYLQQTIEKYTKEISQILNKIHNTEKSVHYWRILIGWWLTVFIQVLFDRWSTALQAANNYPNAEIIKIELPENKMASQSTAEFVWRSCNDELWNEQITSEIFENFTEIKISKIVQSRKTNPEFKQFLNNKNFKLRIWKIVNFCTFKIDKYRKNSVSLESTYLDRKSRLKLLFKLRALPNKFIPFDLTYETLKPEYRNWEFTNENFHAFDRILQHFLPICMPTCYLEGYEKNQKKSEEIASFFCPSELVTGNDHAENESWKFWAANCSERGSKLIIAQHGGGYGSAKNLAIQDYEIAICDRYLSWGWHDQLDSKIYPAPAMKLIDLKKRVDLPDGDLLIVTTVLPQRSYHLGSFPLGPQLESYFTDQLDFVRALSTDAYSRLKIKISSQDFGWNQELRWETFDKNLKIIKDYMNISDMVNDSKLVVVTYNATVFLETFRMDVPTVLFWNSNQWDLNSRAEEFYQILKEAKILFDNPCEAADHINNIWADVNTWWNSIKVREALGKFSEEYACVGERPITNLSKSIKDC
jgi:putative transferase (TIGR04331 family)